MESDWTVELTPIGDDEVYAGELIELYARIDGAQQTLPPAPGLRFDILEEDHILTGWLDDWVVSLSGTRARPPDEEVRIERRVSERYFVESPETVPRFIRRYKRGRDDLELESSILLIDDEVSSGAIVHHVITWWRIVHEGDWANAEYYFVLNVDGAFDDRSTGTLDVAKEMPTVRLERSVWHPQAVTRRLHTLLTTSLLDWSVSEAEAIEAVHLLQTLPAEELITITSLLRLGTVGERTKWDRLVHALGTARDPRAARAFHWLITATGPNHGPITRGDKLRIRVYAGSEADPRVDVELPSSDVTLSLVGTIELLHLTPVEAADRIARAYVGFFSRPSVFITLLERPRYIGHPIPLVTGDAAIEHTSTVRPDPDDPATGRNIKLGQFVAYIQGASADDPVSVNAQLHYLNWIEENRDAPEFLTREPEELWAWALEQSFRDPPRPPAEAYLALARSMMSQRDAAPRVEARRIDRTLHRYLAWLSDNLGSLESAEDPASAWARFHVMIVREEIEAESRRALAEARLPPPVDWEAVGAKLDEALLFVMRNVWRPSRSYVVRWTEEEGGFLGLFEERRSFSSLVQPSESEGLVRGVIGRAYLDDLLERLRRGRDLDVDVGADFQRWIAERPDLHYELLVAHAHPRTETREVEIDLPAWQTAIEIGIGFVPIVGQVVGVIEVTTGRSLFGRELSTAERGVTAGAILLPAAAKIYGAGSRALRVTTLVNDYGDVMTRSEIDALYRAVLPLRPGSPGHTLLSGAADDVAAGRFVADRDTVGGLRRLFDDMGLTDPVTRLRLGLPERAAIGGARLAPEAATTRFLFETLEGETRVYRNLGREARASVRAAANAEPGFLFRTLRSETEGGFNRYRDELLRRMGHHRMPSSQVDELEDALEELHRVRRARLANRVPPHASSRVHGLGSSSLAENEGAQMIAGLRRREEAFRSAAEGATGVERRRALNNASRLKRERERIEGWLRAEGDESLEALVRTVGGDANLQLLAVSGGGSMIRRAWIQFNTRSISVSFPEYMRILTRHYRGNFGEFEVAFRMGHTHVFLKPPDELVTIRGTDLIAVPRAGDGPLLLIDNKALSAAQLDSVTALTRNLPRNIADDVDQLAAVAGAAAVPGRLRAGFERLRAARAEIQERFGDMSRTALERPTVQAEITEILSRHGIERVVTNAGGHVDSLSGELRAMGIDLVDLNTPARGATTSP